MHILYVITQQDAGGAQKYVLDLAAHFHGSIAAGPEGNQLENRATAQHIPFYLLPNMRRALSPYHDALALIELMRLIKQLRPDIVHTNSSKAGILGSLASWLCGVPTVFTAHGFQYLEPMSKLKRWFFWFCEFVCRPFRNFVITVSEYDRNTGLRDLVIAKNRSKTIYHGITTPLFLSPEEARNRLKLPPAQAYIGTIANLYQTKGIDILLDAFAQVHRSLPHARLIIIGDGPERSKLAQQASHLLLTDHISFLGQLPEAAQYLRAFDLFVLPSRKEGFPYVLLEALATRIPIVATKVGGIPEALGATVHSLIPPENPIALAQGVEAILLGTVTSKNNNQQQSFSIQHMFNQTAEVYSRLQPDRSLLRQGL